MPDKSWQRGFTGYWAGDKINRPASQIVPADSYREYEGARPSRGWPERVFFALGMGLFKSFAKRTFDLSGILGDRKQNIAALDL